MKLLLEAPLNGLSLGNVAFNFIRELKKRNVEIGIWPTGDPDLGAYPVSDDLKAYIENGIKFLKFFLLVADDHSI